MSASMKGHVGNVYNQISCPKPKTKHVLSVFVLIFYLISPVCNLVTVKPSDILKLCNNTCFIATTEFTSSDALGVVQNLEDIVSKKLHSVLFGSVKITNFNWKHGHGLKLSDDEKDPEVLIFQKVDADRTCLLPTNVVKYPVVIPFRGNVVKGSLINFINDNCFTYINSNGNLNIQGLHRENILQNIFSVASISNLTTENLVKTKRVNSFDGNLSCEKGSRDCEHDANKQNNKVHNLYTNLNHEIPKCDKIKLPTKDEFFHKYLKLSKPVIIKDAISSWPALKKWTNQFLKNKFGDQDVHIKLTPGGEYEGVEQVNKWEDYTTFKIPEVVKQKLPFPDLVVVRPATMNIKFSEFIDLIENVSSKISKNISAYLEYSSIPDYLPELEDDLKEMPFFEGILKREHLNIWLSDGNTLGKLHFDAFDNILCQISGRKQVILFEPHENKRLYESHIPEAILSYNKATGQFRRKKLLDSTSMVMSPVDISKIDFERFPEFSSTLPLNCTIDEGEVLFMPSYWWHEVQSFPNVTAKRNLAVNFWYEPFLTKEFPCAECKLDVNPKYKHLL